MLHLARNCAAREKRGLCSLVFSLRMLHVQVMYEAEEFSVERWNHFRSVNMYEELCHWLKAGRLDIASTLCDQFSDILSDTLISCLEASLEMVPDKVEVCELCAWLSRTVVLRVLDFHDSEMIMRLAAWIEKRAFDMEVTQKQDWPANAIQLCEILRPDGSGSTVFKDLTPKEYACRIVELAIPQTTLEEARQSHNALVSLQMLRNDLQKLMELRENYNCALSLVEFRMETVQSLAYHLLDRVGAVELISAAIRDVVRPYATQSYLNLDELLSSYVEELVHRRSSGSMLAFALWESKAIEILANISNREMYIRTLLIIVRAARFPWSEEVSSVFETALAENPSHPGLKSQHQQAFLKWILVGYGLQSFDFAERSRAKDLVFHILVKDKSTAVEDALAVTNFYGSVDRVEVYLFRCCFLTERDRPDEIILLLRTVTPASILEKVCERFVRFCSCVLSDHLSTFRRQYAIAASHLRRLLRTLSSPCREYLQNQLSELDAIYRLDSQFGIFVTHDDYCSTAKRQQVCEKWLNKSTETAESKMTAVKKQCQREVSRLVRMPTHYYEAFQAVRVAHGGEIRAAVELAKGIVVSETENDIETVQNVLTILSALCGSIENGCLVAVSNVNAIHELACNLALSAPFSMLDQCLRVARSTRLAMEMAGQCSAESSPIVPIDSTVDPYQQWMFDNYLTDDDCGGVIMETKLAMPLAFSFVRSTLLSAESAVTVAEMTHSSSAMSLTLDTTHAHMPSEDKVQPPVAILRQILDIAGKINQLLTANDQMRLFLGYFLEVAALVGGVSESDKFYGAVLATLKQCISQRRADYPLALAAVLSLPQPVARSNLLKLSRSVGIQYKKALAVAQVGRAFSQVAGNLADLSVIESKLMEARWGYRLAKVHVSFHTCFDGGDKRSLIPTLAANKSISVDDVLQYCQDMKLNVNNSLSLYLTYLLLPSSDAIDGASIVPFSVTRQRAEEACRHIEPQPLVDTLEQLLEKMSSYDYERLEFIVDQLLLTLMSFGGELNQSSGLSILERDKNLFKCLQSYVRVSVPGEEELLLGGDAAKGRLPFHTLRIKNQRWAVITPELNAETVELWIPMAKFLRLPADQVYTTAIRNIVQAHIKQLPVPAQAEWSEGSMDQNFIETVQQLLSKVTNMELAVACVSWIAHQLPPGAEKVTAYSWCVSKLEEQLDSCSPEMRPQTQELLKKHQFSSRQIAIEQVCSYVLNLFVKYWSIFQVFTDAFCWKFAVVEQWQEHCKHIVLLD